MRPFVILCAIVVLIGGAAVSLAAAGPDAWCAGVYEGGKGSNFGRCPGVAFMWWWPGYETYVKGLSDRERQIVDRCVAQGGWYSVSGSSTCEYQAPGAHGGSSGMSTGRGSGRR